MQTRTFEVQVNACADDAWAALIEPGRTTQYFFGLAVHSEWQVGSPIVYQGPGPHQISGELVHVDPPRLLMHSLIDGISPSGDADAIGWITWTIEPVAPGVSNVRVLVDDLESVEDEELDQAWRQLLAKFATHLQPVREPDPRSPST